MPPFVKRALPTLIGLGVLFGVVGLIMLYRALSSNDIGEPCGNNDCNGIMGEYCIFGAEGSYCSPRCDGPDDCPSGWACEHPTEIDQHGGEHFGVTQFCMRPLPPFQAEVLRSGNGTVSEVQGAISGVAVNTRCTWQERSVGPEIGEDYTQWSVECGGTVLYGAGGSGYNPRGDSSWPIGSWVHDPSTTSSDGDPSIQFDGSTIQVRDDAGGPLGLFTVSITTN